MGRIIQLIAVTTIIIFSVFWVAFEPLGDYLRTYIGITMMIIASSIQVGLLEERSRR